MKKFFQKAGHWLDDRLGISENIIPIAKHPVPPGAKWWYVFGSATLFCLILQVVTGISLALLYQPSTKTAYQSLQFIDHQVPLGEILRGLHYFGASAMIVLLGLHMIRVFVLAAYKYPREMTWITGVVLFVLTILMGFTGQLLRWDDAGVWSTIVGAEQMGRIPFIGSKVAHFFLGGKTINGLTLSRFFDFHVFLIPSLLFGFVGIHLYLVIHHGISEPPKAGRKVIPGKYREWYENMLEKKGVPFFPDAAWRDILFGVLVLAVIVGLAVWVGPQKLGGPADPTHFNIKPKPDWYLLWIFAMYALMPPAIESYMIVIMPLIVMVILLGIPFWANRGERSPLKRPWAVVGVVLTVTYILAFWHMGALSPWSPAFNTKPLSTSLVSDTNVVAQKGVKLFYSKGCQYCHAINGKGGRKGPNLNNVGERLNPAEMKIRIVNGSEDMPAYGGSLSDKELKEIVAFLSTRTEEYRKNHDKLHK